MSGGEAQHIKLATELSRRPTGRTLYILDEPTTGLDPKSRRDVQSFLEGLRQREGTTILLTTHDMTEAERLCARIGFLARGKLVAEGTANELKKLAGAETLDDAFISLTGEELATQEDASEEAGVLEEV